MDKKENDVVYMQDLSTPVEQDLSKELGTPDIMGNQSEGRLLLKFAVPAIIGMLSNAAQNIINRIFVGNEAGHLAIAGVVVCFPLLLFFMALAMLVGIGATTLAAIRLGEKKKEDAEHLLGQTISLLVVVPAAACILAWPFQEPILRAFGAKDQVMPYALDYLSIILVSMVFFSLSMGVNNFIRTEGKPQIAMGTQILAALINVIVNYFFVVRFGWGVKGAASGVLIGNLISLIWIFGYFFSPHSYLKIRLKYLPLKMTLVAEILMLGSAPFLMQLANGAQQLVMNRSLSEYGGDMALAAVGIVGSLATLLVLPLIGFNQGSQPIIGYNYGARKLDRVKKTLMKGIGYATIFAVFSFIFVQTCSVQLASLFIDDEPQVIEMTSHALKIFFFCLPIVGYQIMCSGYFQSIGHPFYSGFLSLSRQVLIFIPLMIILPKYWGLEGAWSCAPISDACSVILTFIVTSLSIKKLNHAIEEQGTEVKNPVV